MNDIKDNSIRTNVPQADYFKYLSRGTYYNKFPIQEPVTTRIIKIDGDNARITISFSSQPDLVVDVKTADILPHIVASDFLVVDSKIQQITETSVSLSDNPEKEALLICAFTEAPGQSAIQSRQHPSATPEAPMPEKRSGNYPAKEAFKYLTKNTSYNNDQSIRIVANRLFRGLDNGGAEVTVTFQSGSPITGNLTFEEVPLYIENGDFYTSFPLNQLHVVDDKQLLGNKFSFSLGFSPRVLLVD